MTQQRPHLVQPYFELLVLGACHQGEQCKLLHGRLLQHLLHHKQGLCTPAVNHGISTTTADWVCLPQISPLPAFTQPPQLPLPAFTPACHSFHPVLGVARAHQENTMRLCQPQEERQTHIALSGRIEENSWLTQDCLCTKSIHGGGRGGGAGAHRGGQGGQDPLSYLALYAKTGLVVQSQWNITCICHCQKWGLILWQVQQRCCSSSLQSLCHRNAS